MGLPTLDEFLSVPAGFVSRSSYVEYPGMDTLYVRLGPKYIEGAIYREVLQIANVTAISMGQGAFTALLKDMHSRGYLLYIENVLNPRLAAKLTRMGFAHDLNDDRTATFFLPPLDRHSVMNHPYRVAAPKPTRKLPKLAPELIPVFLTTSFILAILIWHIETLIRDLP